MESSSHCYSDLPAGARQSRRDIDVTFTEEQLKALLEGFGLDKPLGVQYLIYLKNLAIGEFGDSFMHRKPVIEMVMSVLPNTLYLNFAALILAYLIGAIGGIVLAWFRGTPLEKVGVTFTLMTRSAPEFWVGMIALTVFAFNLGWLPSSGATGAGTVYATEWQKLTSGDFWAHMVLPTLTMALYLHGLPLLLMRSNMLEVMQDDFITMGRLMGYSNWRLMMRHAARNALLPVVTALALGIGYSIGGNVVIENVFGWPGIGRLLVSAVAGSDYPLARIPSPPPSAMIVMASSRTCSPACWIHGWAPPGAPGPGPWAESPSRTCNSLDQPAIKRGSPIAQAIAVSLEVFRKDRHSSLVGRNHLPAYSFSWPWQPAHRPAHGELESRPDEVGIWLSSQKPSEQFKLGTTNLGATSSRPFRHAQRAAGRLLRRRRGRPHQDAREPRLGLLWRLDRHGAHAPAGIAFGIPFLPLIIILVAFLKPSIWTSSWRWRLLWRHPDSARVIRAGAPRRSLSSGTRVSRASDLRIMFLYVAPSILQLTFLYRSVAVGWAILTEASVNFLGFGGLQHRERGSISGRLRPGRCRAAPPCGSSPGICIMLAVMAGFFIGQGLRKSSSPSSAGDRRRAMALLENS